MAFFFVSGGVSDEVAAELAVAWAGRPTGWQAGRPPNGPPRVQLQVMELCRRFSYGMNDYGARSSFIECLLQLAGRTLTCTMSAPSPLPPVVVPPAGLTTPLLLLLLLSSFSPSLSSLFLPKPTLPSLSSPSSY